MGDQAPGVVLDEVTAGFHGQRGEQEPVEVASVRGGAVGSQPLIQPVIAWIVVPGVSGAQERGGVEAGGFVSGHVARIAAAQSLESVTVCHSLCSDWG